MPRFYDPGKDIHEYFLEATRVLKEATRVLKSQPMIVHLDGKKAKSFIAEFTPNLTPKITKVVSNKRNGYTIVKFTDGTVSKVKCNNEDYDVEKGIAMAILKALTKYKGLKEILSYFDEKTSSKIEKGIAIYLAKKEIGEERYNNAIKNAKIIEKEEKQNGNY